MWWLRQFNGWLFAQSQPWDYLLIDSVFRDYADTKPRKQSIEVAPIGRIEIFYVELGRTRRLVQRFIGLAKNNYEWRVRSRIERGNTCALHSMRADILSVV